jgi:predicted amidophosphoribosyltransferase
VDRENAFRAATRLLRGTVHGLVALVWPGPCIVCGAALPGSLRNPVCPACWASLPSRIGPGCPRCDLPHAPVAAEGICTDCERLANDDALVVDTLRAALIYRDGAVTVHRHLKLAGADALVAPLARRMAICWALRGPWTPDLVVPVPPDPLRLGPRRRVPRLLARGVAAALHRPLANRIVRKRRPTRPQSRRRGADRLSALRGAFRARPERIRGRRVLLVDDVATTGATLNAVAAALIEAGARRVAGLVLARTP